MLQIQLHIKLSSGFFFIPSVLTEREQQILVKECFTHYLNPPNRTNHDAEFGPIWNLWESVEKEEFLVPYEQPYVDGLCKEENFVEASSSTLKNESEQANGGLIFEANHSKVEIKENYVESSQSSKKSVWVPFGHSSSRVTSARAASVLLRKLRWITLGIQFDWSKVIHFYLS